MRKESSFLQQVRRDILLAQQNNPDDAKTGKQGKFGHKESDPQEKCGKGKFKLIPIQNLNGLEGKHAK